MPVSLIVLGFIATLLLTATIAVMRKTAAGPTDEPLSAEDVAVRPGEQPAPAPWEREGGADLSAPVASAARPEAPEPPAGARFRSTKDELVNGPVVEEVVKGLEKVPPLPRALRQILKELDNAGSTAKSVGAIVATEQVLSASLLRVVNSAAMGLRRQILTVDQAVTYLGFSTVRSLVVRLQVGNLFATKGGSQQGYDAERLWLHSMAVSQVAEHLAGRCRDVDPFLASTLGLLHDIGKLAINAQFPHLVARLWQPGAGPADESFLARERRIFGADHAFVGALLTAKWELPEDLVDAIRLHHAPPDAEAGALIPEVRRALAVVHVSNQLVKYAHVYCADMEIDIVAEPLLADLGLPGSVESLLDERVHRVIQTATQASTAAAAATPAPAGPVGRVA